MPETAIPPATDTLPAEALTPAISGTPCDAGVNAADCSAQAAWATAEATQGLVDWTSYMFIAEIAGFIAAMAAASFAWLAFRQTRRQANATELQAEASTTSVELAERSIQASIEEASAQREHQAELVRGKLSTQDVLINLSHLHEASFLEICFENLGDSDLLNLSALATISITPRGKDEEVFGHAMVLQNIAVLTARKSGFLRQFFKLKVTNFEQDYNAAGYDCSIEISLSWKDHLGYQLKRDVSATHYAHQNVRTKICQFSESVTLVIRPRANLIMDATEPT